MAAQPIPHTSTSGHIAGVAYDEETSELAVTFKGGATYIYSGVTPQDANGFNGAPSATDHLNTYIKPNYAYKKA